MRLPAADDLFRPTADQAQSRAQNRPQSGSEGSAEEQEKQPVRRVRAVPEAGQTAAETEAPAKRSRRSSGRVRHDEKMTVYITSEELLDLEHARLSLRRSHGLAVDRGRLVREAVAIVLADLEAHGEDSALVQRLAGE
ncbi:hypothetical protein [Nocardioides cheoyonin]|uniref:hypothetical protein n=1 Tax=Nocardioides cheoyonin TaxID=3156615 RepID=UPI003CCC7838